MTKREIIDAGYSEGTAIDWRPGFALADFDNAAELDRARTWNAEQGWCELILVTAGRYRWSRTHMQEGG